MEFDESKAIKTLESCGYIRHFIPKMLDRPSLFVAKMLYGMNITPNAVTIFSIACWLTGLLSLMLGRPYPFLMLMWLSQFCDCVDGKLARATGNVTKLGHWLDNYIDLNFKIPITLCAVGFYVGLPYGILALICINLYWMRDSFVKSWKVINNRERIIGLGKPAIWNLYSSGEYITWVLPVVLLFNPILSFVLFGLAELILLIGVVIITNGMAK